MAKNSEYISVADFAKLVNKSQQYIYRLAKNKASFRKYVIDDGHIKIHKSAVSEAFGVEYEGFKTGERQGYTDTKPEAALQQALIDQIELLKKQLETKDAQLADLAQALHHEQILHAETSARLKDTANRLQALEDKQRQQPGADPEQAPAAGTGPVSSSGTPAAGPQEDTSAMTASAGLQENISDTAPADGLDPADEEAAAPDGRFSRFLKWLIGL